MMMYQITRTLIYINIYSSYVNIVRREEKKQNKIS